MNNKYRKKYIIEKRNGIVKEYDCNNKLKFVLKYLEGKIIRKIYY